MGYSPQGEKLEKAPETAKREIPDPGFVTMGEVARWKKEREDKPATPPAEPAAAPPKEEKPAAPVPPTETPPATPKPKIDVERGRPIEEIVEGVVKRLQKPAETPAPTAPATKPADKPEDADADYIASLTEEQQEEINLARYAAKADPAKYGTMPKRLVDYYKKTDEFISSRTKENAEWAPEQDEEFSAFVEENRPAFTKAEKRQMERRMITEEVRNDLKPKLEEIDRASKAQELGPELERATADFTSKVVESMAPDDKSVFHGVVEKALAGKLTEEAWKEARKVDPMAVNIIRPHVERAAGYAREYLELATGVKEQTPFRADMPLNHKHNQAAIRQQEMFAFIEAQESAFYQNGGNLRSINGKTFLPRRDFFALPEAEKSKHWTLSHTDILDMFSRSAAVQAETQFAKEVERRKEEGYVRNSQANVTKTETAAAAPSTPPAASPQPASPKSTVTPSPGAAPGGNMPSGQSLMSKDELDRMLSTGQKRWG